MAVPIVAIVGTSSYFVLIGVSLTLAFFILIGLKLLNEVIDISIVTPSFRTIYQSIPAAQRNKVIGFRETVIEPTAMGVAGLLLLILAQFNSIEIMCVVVLVLSLVWLVLAKPLKNEYVESLKNLLKKRQVVDDTDLFENIDTNLLINNLNSQNDIEVLYALDFLKKIEYEQLESYLPALLNHRNGEVRKKVIEIISFYQYKHLLPALEAQLCIEKEEDVLVTLIHHYCQLNAVESIKNVKVFLDSPSIQVRNQTISALIKYCGIDGILIAGQIINRLIENRDEKSQVEVLEIIKEAGFVGFYDLLEESLLNENSEIKKEAIRTVGNLQVEKFVPLLLEFLENQEYKALTIEALSKYQTISLLLQEEFLLSASYNKQASLIKILAKDKENADFLLEQMQYPIFNYVVIDQLYNGNYRMQDKESLYTIIEESIHSIAQFMYLLNAFDATRFPETYRALHSEKEKKIESIFKMLSFIYPKEIISQAKTNYASTNNKFQALAIELIDNLLDNRLKQTVIPLLEKGDEKQKINYFTTQYKLLEPNRDNYLLSVITNPNTEIIIRLTFIYEIGKIKESSFLEAVKNRLIKETDPYVLETLSWTLSRLEPKG
jgi:HEAT repeat protein